jgi:hypothetical protein
VNVGCAPTREHPTGRNTSRIESSTCPRHDPRVQNRSSCPERGTSDPVQSARRSARSGR